jgi:putative transposase
MALARSTLYYEPMGESAEDLALMRCLDEQYTKTPFYGSRNMVTELKDQGWKVNRKRVQRLMRLMGLEAIYPKPRLSEPAAGHRMYPYLLRNVSVKRPNHVWSTDITYIRLRGGFVYLVAILDWYSRYVLAWEVSTTLDTSFCLSTLDWALKTGKPEIFNSDQGAQFTSVDFTGRLKEEGIQISMDGRGRALDNVFVERLWRTVKYEEVYLNDYSGVPEAVESLGAYFPFYNFRRPHQSLGNQTPAAIYFGIPKRTPQYEKLAMLQLGRVADRRLPGILERNFLHGEEESKRVPLRGTFS